MALSTETFVIFFYLISGNEKVRFRLWISVSRCFSIKLRDFYFKRSAAEKTAPPNHRRKLTNVPYLNLQTDSKLPDRRPLPKLTCSLCQLTPMHIELITKMTHRQQRTCYNETQGQKYENK